MHFSSNFSHQGHYYQGIGSLYALSIPTLFPFQLTSSFQSTLLSPSLRSALGSWPLIGTANCDTCESRVHVIKVEAARGSKA
jgi:hypothetical protein